MQEEWHRLVLFSKMVSCRTDRSVL